MKQVILILLSLTLSQFVFSQGTDGVLIDPNNTTTRDASAVFQAQSTTQGILLPRMTAAQRALIPVNAARNGLLVYQTDSPEGFYYYNGSSWSVLGSTTGMGSAGHVSYWNGTSTQAYDTDANFVWDETNNRLGIGIAVPTAVIDIQKAAPAANEIIFRVGTDGDANRFRVDEDGDIMVGGTADITGDALVRGSDVYDNSGPIRLSGEDEVNITMDYNNDDADIRAIIFGKNSQTAPTELMRIQESGTVQLNTYTTNGLLKTSGANGTLAIATAGTDYLVTEVDGSTSNEIQNLSYTAGTGALGITGGSGVTIPVVTATVRGLVPNPPNNTSTFLRGDGTFAAPVEVDGSTSNEIQSLSYTPASGALGITSGGTGVTIPVVTATVRGLVPNPPNNTTTFLRGDGTFAAVTGTLSGGTTNGVTYWTSATAVGATAVGATNTVLHGNTGAAPSFSAIVSADITDGTITTADILNGTITGTDIATGTVASADITDNSITATDILNGTITGTDIASGTVASANITDNSVSSTDILNGTIATADIANNAIDGSKIGIGTTNGDILYYNGTDWVRLGAGGSGTVLKIASGIPSWGTDATGGDNLGNHTATTTLNLAGNALTGSGGTYIDAGGGWHRSYGNTGWYNGTHAGGWYMTDATWIRNYNSKDVYINTFLRADGGIASGGVSSLGAGTIHATSQIRGTIFYDYDNTGYYIDPASTSNVNVVNTVGNVRIGDATTDAHRFWGILQSGSSSDSHQIIPNAGSWGYVGTPTYYWYEMYARYYNASSGYYYFSDKSIKENIKPIESALDKVQQLQGVTYNIKKDSYLYNEKDPDENLNRIGFVAQDVQKVLPKAVRPVKTENGAELLTVEYSLAIPYLVEAIKEQQAMIEKLQAQEYKSANITDQGTASSEQWIAFSKEFSNSLKGKQPFIIVTPLSSHQGWYIREISDKGFYVKKGESVVTTEEFIFNWQAQIPRSTENN